MLAPPPSEICHRDYGCNPVKAKVFKIYWDLRTLLNGKQIYTTPVSNESQSLKISFHTFKNDKQSVQAYHKKYSMYQWTVVFIILSVEGVCRTGSLSLHFKTPVSHSQIMLRFMNQVKQ